MSSNLGKLSQCSAMHLGGSESYDQTSEQNPKDEEHFVSFFYTLVPLSKCSTPPGRTDCEALKKLAQLCSRAFTKIC